MRLTKLSDVCMDDWQLSRWPSLLSPCIWSQNVLDHLKPMLILCVKRIFDFIRNCLSSPEWSLKVTTRSMWSSMCWRMKASFSNRLWSPVLGDNGTLFTHKHFKGPLLKVDMCEGWVALTLWSIKDKWEGTLLWQWIIMTSICHLKATSKCFWMRRRYLGALWYNVFNVSGRLC